MITITITTIPITTTIATTTISTTTMGSSPELRNSWSDSPRPCDGPTSPISSGSTCNCASAPLLRCSAAPLLRCSAAPLLSAAVCPYVMPKLAVKPMQNAFILVAFPLVAVSAALDALTDLSGGKVNIHVLMALAAFASVFMGNALEGGLLLAMFNLAHIAEEYFTSRSMIDVKDLKENHPDFALVLDINDGQLPNTSDLAYKQVPVQPTSGVVHFGRSW